MPGEHVLVRGIVEKIGLNHACVKYERVPAAEIAFEKEIADHQAGIDNILNLLTDKNNGCLNNIKEIEAVGHRIVHGGEEFKSSVLITKKVLNEIENCIELAPLHNPSNLKGIYAIEKIIPGIRQVAVFDTQFHQSMPPHAYLYAIPYGYYEKGKIRRYGFHGMSHFYVTRKACELLNTAIEKTKIISCHLGNGSSITAIDKGRSIDTSMGYTPLEGLIMGTRSGDLDIGVVTHIMENDHLDHTGINTLLNNESGLLGISGISSDMREIESASKDNNKRAQIALDMFCYRIKKYIGAYSAALNGLDLLIFTGGIGENRPEIRKIVCENLDYLGIKLDANKNKQILSDENIISAENSKVKIIVIPTNEELVIAKDTMEIISGT